jgi:precorrin-8X/cobalt-precorrin-8 methylmutase
MARNQGPCNFSALWKALFEKIRDGAGNVNDRYSFAAWANEHWLKQHYFWGFPTPAHAHLWLAGTKQDTRLPELRLAESNAPGTQPTRKLAYAGSVGSQALLGMRRLHLLRNDPALARVSHVWPMETGFSLPAAPQGTALIVHAEIYPTPVLGLAKASGIEVSAQVAGMVNDAQQAWACAALARHEDDNGTLVGRFAKSRMLRDGQVAQARQEGWILWS